MDETASHDDARATPSRRGFLLAVLALAACAGRRRQALRRGRCPYCGMRVGARSHWRAGGVLTSGEAAVFCTPGCAFRYTVQGSLRDPWVVEYYAPTTAQVDARRVRYALGSDVVGPMGPDLVPVDPVHLDTFDNDHHPRRVVRFEEITPALLNALDGR